MIRCTLHDHVVSYSTRSRAKNNRYGLCLVELCAGIYSRYHTEQTGIFEQFLENTHSGGIGCWWVLYGRVRVACERHHREEPRRLAERKYQLPVWYKNLNTHPRRRRDSPMVLGTFHDFNPSRLIWAFLSDSKVVTFKSTTHIETYPQHGFTIKINMNTNTFNQKKKVSMNNQCKQVNCSKHPALAHHQPVNACLLLLLAIHICCFCCRGEKQQNSIIAGSSENVYVF